MEMSRKSHTALGKVQRIPGATSEAEVERRVEKKRKRKRETCKNIALKATQLSWQHSVTCDCHLSPFHLHGVWFQWKVWDPRCEGKHKQKLSGIPINLWLADFYNIASAPASAPIVKKKSMPSAYSSDVAEDDGDGNSLRGPLVNPV